MSIIRAMISVWRNIHGQMHLTNAVLVPTIDNCKIELFEGWAGKTSVEILGTRSSTNSWPLKNEWLVSHLSAVLKVISLWVCKMGIFMYWWLLSLIRLYDLKYVQAPESWSFWICYGASPFRRNKIWFPEKKYWDSVVSITLWNPYACCIFKVPCHLPLIGLI